MWVGYKPAHLRRSKIDQNGNTTIILVQKSKMPFENKVFQLFVVGTNYIKENKIKFF